MKNKLLFITVILILTATSCQKDLTGSSITITAYANDTIEYFYYRSTHESFCPPINDPSTGTIKAITYTGNGNYLVDLDEEETNTVCISITGTIPENQDTIGYTIINIEAYYTEEGNVVGFQDIKLKRPHDETEIAYQFRPDTYIE